MKLKTLLTRWPVDFLVRVACYLVLAALAINALYIVYPRPLVVIFGIGAAQGVGLLGLLCFLLAVLADARRSGASMRPPSEEPPSGEAR